MIVRLPVPPSANAMYTGRVFKSAAYRDWLTSAHLAVRRELRGVDVHAFERREKFEAVLRVGVGHNRDIDNVIKPVLDALEAARVIPDDRYCNRVEAVRDPDVIGVHVEWGPI